MTAKDAEIARLRAALRHLHALYLDAAEPEAEHTPRWLRDALRDEVTP